ncbi:hypothetical protein [Streptomyces sp. NBC_00859]|nr:hypothetical protein OG584_00775 [Streptomyces sp. NBC_00859]
MERPAPRALWSRLERSHSAGASVNKLGGQATMPYTSVVITSTRSPAA